SPSVPTLEQPRNHLYFQPVPAGMQVHDIWSGDAVMIKVFSRKTKLDPKWEGLYTVLLTSYFAVKVAEKDNWIHHSHSPSLSLLSPRSLLFSRLNNPSSLSLSS
uniref:Murine leukemia virus integrase C-terminal domain-containing protein n=1 Tax=Calidris pygmaea TaxID=425635 RepID=A0A8C3K8N4_9CHAR